MNHIREICTFGFAYSCVIGFCLFGPILRIVTGGDRFSCIVLALAAFILSFLNPFLKFFTSKRMAAAYVMLSVCFVFFDHIFFLKEWIIFLFSFEIATLCRGFTLHVVHRIDENQSEWVISSAFFIAFLILYVINVLEPVLSEKAALTIIILLGCGAVFFYKITIDEALVRKEYANKFDRAAIPSFLSLYLVYIGGGISYAGIYPYLEAFYYIDRYYNVLPLVVFMPIAGLIGRKYGNLTNLFIGILFLSFAFTCFLFSLTETRYLFVQTFLQIGWAFTNVFGFSYSWRLAGKYQNPNLFGYGIICILLGVVSGSIVANFIFLHQLPITFYGPFTFLPLITSLIFQFFHRDHKATADAAEDNSQNIIYNMGLEESVFYDFSILSELTDREKEIIYYYYHSDTAVKIADRLKVSPNTVRTHIKNVYSKLGISKREQLQDLINTYYTDMIN